MKLLYMSGARIRQRNRQRRAGWECRGKANRRGRKDEALGSERCLHSRVALGELGFAVWDVRARETLIASLRVANRCSRALKHEVGEGDALAVVVAGALAHCLGRMHPDAQLIRSELGREGP